MAKTTIELHIGTEGIQQGCIAITVRREDSLTQTPWLILDERWGGKIAREIMAKLRELAPDDEYVAIGFAETVPFEPG